MHSLIKHLRCARHPVHGAEDEGNADADGEARRVVVGRAPVRARVLQQQLPQLRVQRLRVPGRHRHSSGGEMRPFKESRG